jgi:hypothetical protein
MKSTGKADMTIMEQTVNNRLSVLAARNVNVSHFKGLDQVVTSDAMIREIPLGGLTASKW